MASKTAVANVARKPVRSLQVLSQIEIIQTLHKSVTIMENNYMIKFVEKDLSDHHKLVERLTDIRPDKVDTAAFVREFEAKLKTKEAAEETSKKKMKGRVKSSEGKALPRREGLRSSRPKPYEEQSHTQKFLAAIADLRKNSIKEKAQLFPRGVSPGDFIKYKKCKYIEDIKRVRCHLEANLNRACMNNLIDTLENIMEYNDRDESGFLTLLAVMISSETTSINFAPLKLWKALDAKRLVSSSYAGSHYGLPRGPDYIETRTETTLILFALRSASKLSHLQMAGCACDNFLKVVSENCSGLKYIDFSNSYVSDWGFYHLAGLTEVENRSVRLSRKCKSSEQQPCPKLSSDLVKTKKGCENLTHLIANDLMSISWPPRSSKKLIKPMYYANNNGCTDYMSFDTRCPKDSGFVMALQYLPKLKVFMTEIGGRAVESLISDEYGRVAKRKKRSLLLPNLEMISEANMDTDLMCCILQTCPNVKVIKVKSKHVSGGESDETWLNALDQFSHRLEEVSITESDFKGACLANRLLNQENGRRLTRLDLRGLGFMRLSWLQQIKKNCQNLVCLVIGITTKTLHVLSPVTMLDIVCDLNLSNGEGKDDPLLKSLEQFHLIGPFGPDICGYMIKGADKLHNLALTIDWLEAPFCSAQPVSDKDYLGIEYLKEVKKVNDLRSVTELHLASRHRRSRSRLGMSCAHYILTTFHNLQHLGTFKFWNLRVERRNVIESAEKANRRLNFDEDLKCNRLDLPVAFKKRYVDNRRHLSCQDPKSPVSLSNFENNNGMLNDFLDVLANLQGFFDGNGIDENSDSDDSLVDEDFDSDEDSDGGGPGIGFDFLDFGWSDEESSSSEESFD